VSQFKYLGTTVTNQIVILVEITRRLNSSNACYQSDRNILSSRLLSKNVKIRVKEDYDFACCSVWVRDLVEQLMRFVQTSCQQFLLLVATAAPNFNCWRPTSASVSVSVSASASASVSASVITEFFLVSGVSENKDSSVKVSHFWDRLLDSSILFT
jgi:hypothetical protein